MAEIKALSEMKCRQKKRDPNNPLNDEKKIGAKPSSSGASYGVQEFFIELL